VIDAVYFAVVTLGVWLDRDDKTHAMQAVQSTPKDGVCV
jgi:hypothetical protein